MCGEKHPGRRCSQPARGSPPRVRGKGEGERCLSRVFGITPACAGKSSGRQRRNSGAWDHPRVCGEKNPLSQLLKSDGGSPPRVRGKAGVVSKPNLVFGITPACAGKRTTSPTPRAETWDHPRVCGEKDKLLIDQLGIQGSPPRVRGKASGSSA